MKKKRTIGVSSTPPASTATPLGTKRSKKNLNLVPKVVDTPASDAVTLSQMSAITPTPKGALNMQLTLKSSSKNGKMAFYSGARTVIRISKSAFADGNAPQTIGVEDVFAGPKQPKPALTAEERKAARAAKPKLTLAEKIAKREAALAKLKAQAAAEPAPASL